MNHRELVSALTPLHGAGEARAIVRMVMEECFGLSQTDLLLGKDTDLSATDRAEMEKIALRLLKGEPVQYVLGNAYFCGHRFRVTPDVLIPRPETEELVEWACSLLVPGATGKVLDLCTGSGCIAISIALAFPGAHVMGVDVSAPALSVASDNALSLGADNVTFLQRDILSEVTTSSPYGEEHEGGFSMLVSNPPYVRASEAAEMHSTVLEHEPALALFVSDDNPLIFYHSIAKVGLVSLCPGAPVIVELNTALAAETHALFESYGYTDIQIRNDQFGRPRMLRALMPI